MRQNAKLYHKEKNPLICPVFIGAFATFALN